MLNKIDHVAIAVSSIDDAVKRYSGMFGFKVLDSLVDAGGEFKSTMISADDVNIELLQPINPEGAIAKFLAKHGEGIHHVSFNVSDIKKEMQTLKTKGARLINDEPVPVSTDKVAYVHPRSTGGVLIELIQRG
jgi:methylmalonyl-CoA/ethylmalonyl-CoA epimerase